MPFIAKSLSTSARIDITEYKNPRLDLTKGDLVCPFCNEPFTIVQGMSKKVAHFRHLTDCKSDYISHPESLEHHIAKKIIATKLHESIQEYNNIKPQFEYAVKEIKRIIDVAFVFPNGWVVAHEIQLSSITIEELEARTNDYLKAGIDVFWWLGKAADTRTNREWCINRFGECLQIDYDRISDYRDDYLLSSSS